MAADFAWLVSFLADFAQLAEILWSAASMPNPKTGWSRRSREIAFEYRRLKNGHKVSLKQTTKRD
jgi:hypothetical protein